MRRPVNGNSQTLRVRGIATLTRPSGHVVLAVPYRTDCPPSFAASNRKGSGQADL